MAQERVTRLVIPSDLSEAAVVQARILADLDAVHFPEHSRFAVRLALDEALSNAIHHGNGDDPAKSVTVEYRVTPLRVTVSVEDQGPGFRPRRLPDPTRDENLERPHGRGVMLIKAYMTRVAFNRAGNRVTMIKERDCPLPNRA